SENFFKDDKGEVFLIDFGFTNISHSIIDYTSLECSIKYNHIPRYVKLEDLLELERELLQDDTFTNSYSFKICSKRKDLARYCEVIRKIRILSEEFLLDRNKKIEYYISLFIMTYRQVRYRNMNQLYALESSKITLARIIQILGL